MAIKVKCQQCGKSAVFADADAGMTALCTACGAHFLIPAEFVDTMQANSPPPADPPPPELPEGQDAPTLPEPTSGQRPILFGLLAGAGAAIALIAIVLFTAWNGPTWESAHAAEIRKLKADADALVIQNRLADAYEAYRKLDELVATRELNDPALRDDVQKARAMRDRLFETVFQQNSRQYASAVNPPPATAPATRPAVESPRSEDPPHTRPVEIARVDPGAKMEPKTEKPVPEIPRVETPKPENPPTRPVDPAPDAVEPPPAKITIHAREDTRPESERRAGGIRKVRVDWGDGGVTDAEIGRAIERAVDHLLGRFQNGMIASGDRRGNDAYGSGLNALCVYALLQASFAIKDERLNLKGPIIREMIDKMKKSPMEQGPVTYARGIRATALALVNRPEDRETLRADVSYLLGSHLNGGYTYSATMRPAMTHRGSDPPPIMGDNSNAQYGLLGVWSGAEVGVEVNNAYWQAVESHWTRCQNEDGSWSYSGYGGRGQGRISMTLAGLASLLVTHDYLDAPKYGTSVGRDPFSPALKRGLARLESEDTAINIQGGYTIYGLERVGLASGFKYFGKHDWYRVLAKGLVDRQTPGGSWNAGDGWGGPEVVTAYNLLFLARGRHPILMNKLRYEGAWANRPRDVSNLARFGSHELERPLNWQVVPVSRDWIDWMDSPILYISNHIIPHFKEEEIDKIRSYVQAGGMLFTQSDGNSVAANAGFEELARKLFPVYEMKDLPDDHEIFSILFKPSPRPKLRCVSNGSRILMVHSPTDISQCWQLRQDKSRRSIFELGTNLFLYAAGKGDLRNRLASPYIPPPPRQASGGTVQIVRLKYPGNWDPEPMAWTRFARYFQHETDVAVEMKTVEMSAAGQIEMKVPTIAHWTGTAVYTPTEPELAAIRKFVQRGGLLLVEPTGGSGEFAQSAGIALRKALQTQPRLVPQDHPMLTGGGQAGTEDASTVMLRPYAKARSIGSSGRLDRFKCGRGEALLTPLDMTTGLLGANTWGIFGYSPDYACALMKNLIIWNAMGRAD